MTTKAKARHTAGPWTLGIFGSITGGPFIEYANGKAQSQVASATVGNGIMPEERKANARLISAAPDLLEALNRVMVHFFGQDEPACLDCGGNLGTGEGCDTCYVWTEAVNALRKAGGDL